jgi:calcineurin-like phosphoesterase family protein
MTTFITSDLHLGHINIIEWRQFEGTFFNSVDEMNQTLIHNWNNVVEQDDVVYIVGDVVMGQRDKNLRLVDDLNGTKFLIPGNHDLCHPMYQNKKKMHKWITAYAEYMEILDTNIEMVLPSRGEEMLIVDVCHFPSEADHAVDENGDPYVRYADWRPAQTGHWLLCGHVHGSYGRLIAPQQIDVGVDAWDLAPVPLETIRDFIEDLSIEDPS